MDGQRRKPSDVDRLIAGMKRTRIPRRRFLQAAAMAPAAAFLAACERQIGRTPRTESPEAPPTTETRPRRVVVTQSGFSSWT